MNTTSSAYVARYGRVAIALHWMIGLALLAQIAFGFLLDDIAPRGTPARATTINLHKSVGIVLGVLIVARLAWRLRHRPPAWPGSMPIWQQRAARVSHRALYVCMIAQPLSGYVASNFSKHGIKFFGSTWRAWGPDLPAVYTFFNGLHIAIAWAFCGLIILHVAAAIKHRWIDHDSEMTRMWPSASA